MKKQQKAYLNIFLWISVAIAVYEVYYMLSNNYYSGLSFILFLIPGMLAYVFYYLKNL